jgi:hypothetical protein
VSFGGGVQYGEKSLKWGAEKMGLGANNLATLILVFRLSERHVAYSFRIPTRKRTRRNTDYH